MFLFFLKWFSLLLVLAVQRVFADDNLGQLLAEFLYVHLCIYFYTDAVRCPVISPQTTCVEF